VRPDRRFVDVDAPAGAIRDDKFAVLYYRGVDEKLIPPGDAVDVDFYGAEIGLFFHDKGYVQQRRLSCFGFDPTYAMLTVVV
jgi:hypothetical protein